MTEYEIVDAAGTFHGVGIAAISLYFTVLSAYLITAYLVGKELVRSQVIIVSALFIFMALAGTWGTFSYFRWAALFVMNAPEALPQNFGQSGLPFRPYQVIAIIEFSGIFACLKFMWNVRHPKTE